MMPKVSRGILNNQCFNWGGCKRHGFKWNSFRMLLLISLGYPFLMAIQVVYFQSSLNFEVQFEKTTLSYVQRDNGSPRHLFDSKIKGARVMVRNDGIFRHHRHIPSAINHDGNNTLYIDKRQNNIWCWGEIDLVDGSQFTIILDDGEKKIHNIGTNDIKTELEASSWLTELYGDKLTGAIIDSKFPKSDECGFKPLFPFSWINRAPRTLYKTRNIGSRIMARSSYDEKWYWAKICQVLESEQYVVKFDNGDIIISIRSEMLTEFEASLWMLSILNSGQVIIPALPVSMPELDQVSVRTNDAIIKDPTSDFSKLWVGGVSKQPKISFVISVCHGDLGWLTDFASGYHIHKIIIISKCGLNWESDSLPKSVTVIELPNVGRCDHSYAYYLAHVNDQSINNDEVVFFLKDNIGVRRPARALSLDRMMRVIDEKGFACFEEPLSGLSTFHKTSVYSTFNMPEYSRLERDTKKSFKNPSYRDLRDYANALNISLDSPLIPVCYGGNFAARSSQISKLSMDFWISIEKSLSRADNIKEGHFQERLWAGILSEPLSLEQSHTLLKNYTLVDPLQYKGGLVGTLVHVSNTNTITHAVTTYSKFLNGLSESNIDDSTQGEEDTRILVFYAIFMKDAVDAIKVDKLIPEQMSLLSSQHKLYHVDSFGVPISLSINATISTHHEEISTKPKTLHSLWQYCRSHRNDKVVYLHTDTKEKQKKLVTMVIRGALSNKCATLPSSCNVCSTRMTPLPHPQSPYNMWLARCDYVARLIDPLLFAKSMSKIAPNKSFCRGVGKSSAEHWIYSHPTVQPCDLNTNPELKNNEFKPLTDNFEMDLQPAPRFHVEVYRHAKKKYCPQSGETLKERIEEYVALYDERPRSSWWGWEFFNTEYQAPLPINNFPSAREQIKTGSLVPIDYNMLWVGGVSKYPAISIIISFCRGNLDWLEDFMEGYNIHKITILSKCGLTWKLDALPEGIESFELPNVGRCDHSYAYWMANIYEPTDKAELFFFLKDNIGVRRPARARLIDSMIRITNEVGFACFEEPKEGFSVFHETSTLQTFQLSGYSRLKYRDSETSFKNPLFTTFRDYEEALNLSLPTPVTPVCYGGNFMVRSSQISKRSQNFWQNMEHTLTRADSIEEGHFQERAWAGILIEPFNTDTARKVLRGGEVITAPPLTGVFKTNHENEIEKLFSRSKPTTAVLYDLFLSLPTIGIEKERDGIFAAVNKVGGKGSKRIPIFYNLNVPATAHIRSIEKLMAEQMSLIRPKHVMYHIDSIGVKFSLPNNTSYRHYSTSSEEVTLQFLWQYCRESRSDKVIYLNKDSRVKESNIFASGALSSECETLPDTCNVCGTRMSPIPHPQFAGNMWLARCEYVAQLIDPLIFGDKMKKIAPGTAFCRGVGHSASIHWINSHPAVMPCDLHSSRDFLTTNDASFLPSLDYEPELKSAPRVDKLAYSNKSNCGNDGHTIKQRVDEYTELYGHGPSKLWWGWKFFGIPYESANHGSF